MNQQNRSIATLAALSLAAVACSEQARPEHPLSFFEKLQLITQSWWLTTGVACLLVGLLIGFFVYRAAVSNGQAGSATGTGCLVAVIAFLVAQVISISVLVATVFSAPTNPPPAQPAHTEPTKQGVGVERPNDRASDKPERSGKPTPPAGTTGDDF